MTILDKKIIGGIITILLILSGVIVSFQFSKDYTNIYRNDEKLASTRWVIEAQRTFIVKDSWYDRNVKCPKIINMGGRETATRCYYPDNYYEQMSRSLINTKISEQDFIVTRNTPYYAYGTRGSYAGKVNEVFTFIETTKEEEFPGSYATTWTPKDTRRYKSVLRVWNLKEQPLINGRYNNCVYRAKNIKIDLQDECSKLDYVEVKDNKIYFYFKPERDVQIFNIKIVDPTESTWCYQETANASHGSDGNCGLEYTGTYEENTWWTGDSSLKMRDGNWSSETHGVAANTGIMELNYSKPANATHGTKWNYSDNVGHGDNLTFPLQCWNFDTDMLVLKIESNDAAQFCKWYCHNATEWQILRETSGTGGNIYEDGIYWNITTTSSDSSDTGMEDYLVGYWKLDGNALDSSGHGNDGTTTATITNDGKYNEAYKFNGINAIDLGVYYNNMKTVSVWIKTGSVLSNRRIVTNGHSGSNSWVLQMSVGKLDITNASTGDNSKFTTTDTFNDEKWHYVVASINPHFIYVDGVNQSGITGVSGLSVNGFAKIGERGAGSFKFNGTIDEVRIYNKSLSQSEILELYNQSKYTTELAIYSSAGESVIRPESLIDSWKFDDSFNSESGIVYSGGGGSPLLSNDGKYGSCYFHRDNSIMYYSNNRYKLINSANMSFFAWINPNGVEISESPEIAALYGSITEAYWNFRFSTSATKLSLSIRDYQGNTTTCTATTAYNPADKIGKWAHVGVTYNSTNILIYTNGEKVGSCIATNLDEINYTNILRMGYGFNNHKFNGSIDEVNYWNTSLTAEEIKTLYNESKYSNEIAIYSNLSEIIIQSDRLVGEWDLDGDTNDTSGHGNNGTVTGAVVTNNSKFGEAYSFDGDDYISMDDGSSLNITGNLTFSTWIRPYSLKGWQSIMGKSGGSVGTTQYSLYTSGDDIQFIITNSTNSIFTTTANVLTDNTWTFVMGTINGTHLVVYIDGVFGSAKEISGIQSVTTEVFMIGARNTASPEDFFNGTIDEVKVWNTTLTASEILKLYSQSEYSNEWAVYGSPSEI